MYKICHIAPFAPNRCGLYEAARDMCKADALAGHTVYFVDAGITVGGAREASQVGAVDERAGLKLETANPSVINDADVIIMHTGAPDEWLVKCQAPILWMVHGKPLDAFRPEQNGERASYSLYGNLSKWKRSKKMIYFWPEYKPYWLTIIEESKHVIFEYPVIDEQRFSSSDEKIKLEHPGK